VCIIYARIITCAQTVNAFVTTLIISFWFAYDVYNNLSRSRISTLLQTLRNGPVEKDRVNTAQCCCMTENCRSRLQLFTYGGHF